MDTFNNNKHKNTLISEKQSKDSGMALVLIMLILTITLKESFYLYLAIVFHVLNMIWPVLFKPFAIIWLGFSKFLGTIMSKIILSLIFFIVVTPIGILRRALGKDSLKITEFKKGNASVFTERNHTYTKEDLAQPY